jgi:hypothetical protein
MLDLHAITSLVISIIATVALVKVLFGIFAKQAYGRLTNGIMLAFSGAMALEWLIGISLFVSLGKWSDGSLWGHAFTMTSAVLVACLPLLWQHLDAATRYRRSLLVLLGAFLLALTGVLFVPLAVGLIMLLLVLGTVDLLFLLGGRRPRQQHTGLDGPSSSLGSQDTVTQPVSTGMETEHMRRSWCHSCLLR